MIRRLRQIALITGCCTALLAGTPTSSEACCLFPWLFGHGCGYGSSCCYQPACCSPCSPCGSGCSTCGYGPSYYGGCSSCGTGGDVYGGGYAPSGGCASGNCGVTYRPAYPLEPAFVKAMFSPVPAVTVVRKQPAAQNYVPVKYEAAPRLIPQREMAPAYHGGPRLSPEAKNLRARHPQVVRTSRSNKPLEPRRHVIRTSVAPDSLLR